MSIARAAVNKVRSRVRPERSFGSKLVFLKPLLFLLAVSPLSIVVCEGFANLVLARLRGGGGLLLSTGQNSHDAMKTEANNKGLEGFRDLDVESVRKADICFSIKLGMIVALAASSAVKAGNLFHPNPLRMIEKTYNIPLAKVAHA